MKLADDVEFSLGMTVYTPSGQPYETSPNTHIIDVYDYGPPHGVVHSIGRDHTATTQLNRFYSSRASAIDAKIGSIRQEIATLEEDIRYLESEKTR